MQDATAHRASASHRAGSLADTATASERRVASTSLLRPSATDFVVRAPVSSSENARVS
jgi:hypothetical protein